MAIKTADKAGATKKASKRPRAASPSGSSSSGSAGGDDDRAAMLAALEAHGRAMFGFDGPEEAESSEQGRRRLSGTSESGTGEEEDSDDDDAEAFSSDDGWGEGDEMVTDSEDEMIVASKPGKLWKLCMSSLAYFLAIKSVAPVSRVPEVVFAETTTGKSEAISKSDRRAFLVCNVPSGSVRVLITRKAHLPR
jgi:hypothetical protein